MKDRHGNEWVFLPRSMLKLDLDPRDCMGFNAALDRAINSAIAAAPKFEAVEVDDAMCDRVEERAYLHGDHVENGNGEAEVWLEAWRAELGPTLGLMSWREPTVYECERIADGYLARIPRVLAISHPRCYGVSMFNAVRAVMWPKGGES